MITFSPIRSRRMDAQLREISIGDEIALCHLPEKANEKALTEFLQRCIENADAPTPKHIANPRAWSVSERIYALAHYCTHTRDDKPDYAVTDVSKLSDYLDFSRDIPTTPTTFEALGDKWVLQPLTGAAAEAIETLQFESKLSGLEHWLIGAMSAQLVRDGEAIPDACLQSAEYMEWLRRRIDIVRALPSSAFDVLYSCYRIAVEQDTQFFRVWFDKDGVIVLAKKEAGGEIPPARFHILAAIGGIALSITGKT